MTATVAPTPAQANEINTVYQAELGRNADPSGLQTFANLLNKGGSVRDVANDVATSPEGKAYQAKLNAEAGSNTPQALSDLIGNVQATDALNHLYVAQSAQQFQQLQTLSFGNK